MNNRVNGNHYFGNSIDILELCRKLLRKWYLILACMLFGASLGSLYSTFFVKPIYSSTAKLYLRGNSNHISLESLSLSSRLAGDYEIIFKSRPNIQAVIDNLGLDKNVKSVQNSITIVNIDDTHILEITALANSPEEARDIANAVMEQGMDSVREIDSQEPYVVEKAIANPVRINRQHQRYVLFGGITGAMIMCGIIALIYVMNDHIQSREDIENYIGIPVLATVLEIESGKKGKRKK